MLHWIQPTTSGSKQVFHVFVALAEFECGVIRERTLSGLQAARSCSHRWSPPALAAKALLCNPVIAMADVARQLGVCPRCSAGPASGPHRGPEV